MKTKPHPDTLSSYQQLRQQAEDKSCAAFIDWISRPNPLFDLMAGKKRPHLDAEERKALERFNYIAY
jgi:hypothetical protein